MIKNKIFIFFLIVSFLISLNFVSANVQFNGTIKDENGNFLNNTFINITVRSQAGWSVVGYNTTTSNASGWFNLVLQANEAQTAQWMYETSIVHFNGSFADYKSKTIPGFPADVIKELAGTTFYLTPAGTINISAVNSSGGKVAFKYQIKDTKLGYPIASYFDSSVNDTLIYVPLNRNYSVMVYPDRSMPISFNWNNFTSSSSYTFNTISSYNATSKTVNKCFNVTMSTPRLSGSIDYAGISSWDEFTVIPFLVEGGNMIHAQYGPMPFNMSGFMNNGVTDNSTDFFNITNGVYNISIPATVESSTILLFATAKNGSKYYGGFRNISLSYDSYPSNRMEVQNFNFSWIFGLIGGNGTSTTNITMDTSMQTPNKINISTAKQIFNLINSTNSTIGNTTAHVEVKVDYSSFGAIEFTWMTDIAQSSSVSIFALSLLNSTGVKEMNIYANSAGTSEYAPKTVSFTSSEMSPHLSGSNITLKVFNPGDIGANLATSSITMALYQSNSTCDIPNPPTSCIIGGSAQTMATFNPMQAVMGGGKLSFRMGTGNILIHYVNVDLLASGPPDALFDSNTNTNSTTTSSFSSVARFGSGGPRIYDYVLISMPYSETAGSGLDDSATVRMNIPLFYDDNWNVIWNTATNGTSAKAFTANYSHYSTYAGEWSYLMNQSTCSSTAITTSSQISKSSPCYIDTSNNKIWIRLPHFSGAGPTISGTTIASPTSASSSSGSSSSSATGGASVANLPVNELKESESITTSLLAKDESFKFTLDKSVDHILTVVLVTKDSAKIRITSDPIEIELKINEEKQVDVDNDKINDISIKLERIVNDMFAKFSLKKLAKEELPSKEANVTINETVKEVKEEIKEKTVNKKYYLIAGIIIIAVIIFLVLRKKESIS